MRIAINGRFLAASGASATGIHRVARSLLDAARDAGLDTEVIAPAGTADRRADRRVWSPPGSVGLHAWEQILLPLAARGNALVSLANTAPVAVRRSAVLISDFSTVLGHDWFTARYRASGRLVLAAARRARAVLVYAEAVRREAVDTGFDARRVFVVRPAVGASFRPSPSEEVDAVRSRLALARPYLLFVGWADPRKDVATAVAAHIAAVRTVAHDLVLVGGTHRNFAPIRVPEAPTVRRIGAVDEDTLRAALTGAAALVYPSRYEGFGLPPLEALSCGTPAIVSDIPVLRESAGDGVRYVAPGDVDAWTVAVLDALRGDIAPGRPPAWSWSDAATSFLHALDASGLR